MQSPEEFLLDYVRSRTDVLRETYRLREPHVQRFFAPDYEPWNREKSIANSESETTELVTSANGFTQLVTTSEHFGYIERIRYSLRPAVGSWRITSMERECGVCHGSGAHGTAACKPCKGKGWSLIGEKRVA